MGLALGALLLACTGGGEAAAPVAPAPAPAPVPAPAPAPEAPGCAVDAVVPGLAAPWTRAAAADLVPSLHGWFDDCTAARGDFDGDGDLDLAAILLNRETGDTQLAFALTGAAGLLEAARWPAAPASAGGAVYTVLQLKPAGQAVVREHPLVGEGVLDPARAAVEICAPGAADEAGLPASFDDSNLCYCTRILLVEAGAVKQWLGCD